MGIIKMQKCEDIIVHGATYGPKNVTDIVREKFQSGDTNFKANNGLFGDPCPEIVKFLTIIYQYSSEKLYGSRCPKRALFTSITKENDDVEPLQDSKSGYLDNRILGASYGPKDVSEIVREKFQNSKECNFEANNALFGDPCPGIVKFLTIVYYNEKDEICTRTVKENESALCTVL